MGKQGNLSQIPHCLQKASPDPCQLEQMAESKSKEELIRAMRDVAWSENFMPKGNLFFTTLFSQQEYTGSKNRLNWSPFAEAKQQAIDLRVEQVPWLRFHGISLVSLS